MCDLTGTPRQIEVRYVCDYTTAHTFHDVKEVTTCTYQAVVHTNLLCGNPVYRSSEQDIHAIQCFARLVFWLCAFASAALR